MTQPYQSPATNKQNFNAFDESVLKPSFEADQGMYDSFTDTAYQQATRTLDPYYDSLKKEFDQTAINKGLAPNTEAYNTAFDQYMRQQNDAYTTAAYDAMKYGADRLDADRNYYEEARQFDAGFLEQGRQYDNSFLEGQRQFDVTDDTNRYIAEKNLMASAAAAGNALALGREQLAEDARQFDLGYEEDNSRWDDTFGLNEILTMEGIADTYRDDAYRDAVFNEQMDQQDFNNLYAMMGLYPNSGATPVNTSAGFDNALYADIYNANSQDDFYTAMGQILADLAESKPWE